MAKLSTDETHAAERVAATLARYVSDRFVDAVVSGYQVEPQSGATRAEKLLVALQEGLGDDARARVAATIFCAVVNATVPGHEQADRPAPGHFDHLVADLKGLGLRSRELARVGRQVRQFRWAQSDLHPSQVGAASLETFPNARQVRERDGCRALFSEARGRYQLIIDERPLAFCLDADEGAEIVDSFLTVYEFDDDGERGRQFAALYPRPVRAAT